MLSRAWILPLLLTPLIQADTLRHQPLECVPDSLDRLMHEFDEGSTLDLPRGSAQREALSETREGGRSPNPYFDTAASARIKLEAAKALPDDPINYAPPRLSTRPTPKGLVYRIEGRTFQVKDLSIPVEGLEYQPPFSPEEMQKLWIDARRKCQPEISRAEERMRRQPRSRVDGEINSILRNSMEKEFLAALQERLSLELRGTAGSGLRRINAIDAQNPHELYRIFKNFHVAQGELKILSPEQVLKGMQEDLLMEGITQAIAEKAKAANQPSPWIPVRTRIPQRTTGPSLSGVYRVERIADARPVRDLIEGSAPVSRALEGKLRAARAARDEYDPHVMAIRHRVYRSLLPREYR